VKREKKKKGETKNRDTIVLSTVAQLAVFVVSFFRLLLPFLFSFPSRADFRRSILGFLVGFFKSGNNEKQLVYRARNR